MVAGHASLSGGPGFVPEIMPTRLLDANIGKNLKYVTSVAFGHTKQINGYNCKSHAASPEIP